MTVGTVPEVRARTIHGGKPPSPSAVMMTGGRNLAPPLTEFSEIVPHDNPAKQGVSPCNKPTHDKPGKFLHYCG